MLIAFNKLLENIFTPSQVDIGRRPEGSELPIQELGEAVQVTKISKHSLPI
jgi:hypothetical protein